MSIKALAKEAHALSLQIGRRERRLAAIKDDLQDRLSEGTTFAGKFKVTKLWVPEFDVKPHKGGKFWSLRIRPA